MYAICKRFVRTLWVDKLHNPLIVRPRERTIYAYLNAHNSGRFTHRTAEFRVNRINVFLTLLTRTINTFTITRARIPLELCAPVCESRPVCVQYSIEKIFFFLKMQLIIRVRSVYKRMHSVSSSLNVLRINYFLIFEPR